MNICLNLNDHTAGITLGVGILAAILAAINIWALFKAPKNALRIQKEIEANNEKKQKKLHIFKALMATRADVLSLEHVKALNMIDIEFYNEKSIRNAWDTYRKRLNSYPQNQNERDKKNWTDKTKEYLSDLLCSISKLLDYDENLPKNGAYIPEMHYWKRYEEAVIRSNLIKVLNGQTALKVEIFQINTNNI